MKNPFKSLESFEKEDKKRFFGRKKETAQLYNAVHASNLILVYGASGTGKTSLINCGLANEFHDTDWLPIFIRRGSDLNVSIQREMRKLLKEDLPDNALRHQVRELYMEYYRPVYLIFDQFEELYIMGTKEEQEKFHRTISALLQSGVQCKIILIIREEYIAYLSEFEKIVPPLFDNRLRIEKMSERNLMRVVSGTCKYGGIDLKEPRKTVPMIIDNLRPSGKKREGIDLTNLQVYLDRLWRKDLIRQGLPEQQIPTYEPDKVSFDAPLVDSVGKMENVLSEFLDEKMTEVEYGLKQRGVPKPEGLPLEILFTLVTEDGTKRNMDPVAILDDLPRNRQMTEADLNFCMDEFYRIKLLRRFADEE